jgi:ataxia telangiectasia mutated family protein
LDDAGYHSILEALFQVATLEKHAYLAAKNAAQKSKTEAALASCSDLLHTAIRAGADKLTPKTVIAVIEHVTQLLPVAGGEYCAGLSSFYLKTLGSLFEYQAHVEQLKLGDWLSIVDFCLEGIAEYQSDSSWQTPTSSRKASNGATASSHQAPSSSTKLSMRSISDGGSAVSTAKRNSDELLHCLLHLISPANAPILERAEALYEGILRFLESRDSSISFVHQVAFSAMNLLLSSTSADRTALTQAAAVRLIPLVSRLWSSRAGGSSKDEMLNSVKDEMLVTLLLLRHWMERMMRVPSLGELRLQLVDLEEVLRLDYSRRLEPQQLQLEDLDMGSSAIEAPFESCIFAGDHILKSSTARAERSWAVLYVLALLNRLLTLENGRTAIDDGEADDEASIHPRKRRRLVQRLDTLSSALNSQNEAQQVAALHILLFLLPEQRLDVSELSDLLQNLSLRVPSRQRNIGAWALMCIARYANST